jgi:hypothetical protein
MKLNTLFYIPVINYLYSTFDMISAILSFVKFLKRLELVHYFSHTPSVFTYYSP